MSKQPKKNVPTYSPAERRAEDEIDRLLQTISPPSARSVLEQLRDLA